MSVGASGNTIQIALSGAPVSTKTVIVTEASDFPTPSAGVITLAADTDYLISNDIAPLTFPLNIPLFPHIFVTVVYPIFGHYIPIIGTIILFITEHPL